MRIITTIDEMREFSREAKRSGKTIGFVPTMGYLHEGHLSLIRQARKECDAVVVSVFVNPAQFAPGEDLEKYPRDMARDKRLAEQAGTDIIFAPSAEEMYPGDDPVYVDVPGDITDIMCARSRPGHFRGVATVVAKLFNIVCPDRSYFGRKDAQQALVIKRMVKDLNVPTDVRVMPIVREPDGLAMSSRNSYLSAEERKKALRLSASLKKAEEMVSSGERSAERIKRQMKKMIEEDSGVKVDYIETVNADDLRPAHSVKAGTLIAVAAYVGSTRLIDNIAVSYTHLTLPTN